MDGSTFPSNKEGDHQARSCFLTKKKKTQEKSCSSQDYYESDAQVFAQEMQEKQRKNKQKSDHRFRGSRKKVSVNVTSFDVDFKLYNLHFTSKSLVLVLMNAEHGAAGAMGRVNISEIR